jgi:hypothetical protein
VKTQGPVAGSHQSRMQSDVRSGIGKIEIEIEMCDILARAEGE